MKGNPRQSLDSGFHTVDSRFQVLDCGLCRWNIDSGFQSLVGFWIPKAVFQIPQAEISRFADRLNQSLVSPVAQATEMPSLLYT